MILKKIELLNFRNYEKLDLEFDEKINVFIGDNAQGKTNILESIYVLALTRSHRTTIDENLIRHQFPFCKIKGQIKTKDSLKKMEIIINNKEKEAKINNKKIRKLTNYIANLKVIMFCPDNLDIVKGSPSIRRRYIDIELAQISKRYVTALNEYNKLLKIRNEYLKLMAATNIKDKTYYEVLTNKFIDRAVKIYIERKKFIADINLCISKIYKHITSSGHLFLKYESFSELEISAENELKLKLKEKIDNAFSKEMQQGMSLIGPHRDDIIFYLNEQDVKVFGSQGQQRAAVLALKIAEIEIFKKATNEYPILLLDDVFSEFDKKKINKIFKYVIDGFQTFITTTDIDILKKKVIKRARIYYIKDQKVKLKQEVKENG